MPVQAPRRLFTVDEFYQMAGAGIFGEDDRVELLAGEIVEMTPNGPRHSGCVNYLTQILTTTLGGVATVIVQNPVRLDQYSEPQPDLTVAKPRADFYRGGHPGPDDVPLVIEVADTSVHIDRLEKIPLYSRLGIPEVWVVDLPGGMVDVYRHPTPDGYQQHRQVRPGARLTCAALPMVDLPASDVLA